MSKDPVLDALKNIFGGDKDKNKEKDKEPAQNAGSQGTEVAPGVTEPTPTQPAPVQEAAPAPVQAAPEPAPIWQAAPEPAPVQSAPEPAVSAPEPTPIQAAPEPAVSAPAPASGGGDVEQINGYAVGFAFLRYYREHPEIGQPVDEQHGNVGGFQMFENAILHWDGENVRSEWREGHAPRQNQSFEAATQSQPRTYRVNSGDSLWAIAQEVYGDGSQWQRIYNANRDKISNPDVIHPGQELQIP